jgi:exopolysaccharide production protein ExoZ
MRSKLRVRPGKVVSVQYLRALAATLVVFIHARQFPGFEKALDTTVGHAGVDIFFVISGFVMAVTARRPDYPAGRFLIKRLIRIVPIYWFLTIITAGLLVSAPSLFRDNIFTWPHFVLSLLFIPHLSPVGGYSPLIKIGWTLNFEMFFYIVFGAFLFLELTRRICVIGLLFTLLIGVNKLWHPHFVALNFLGNAILLEFVIGCIIGRMYSAGTLARIPRGVAWIGIVLGATGLLAFGTSESELHRLFRFGLPGALIVAAMVSLEQRGSIGFWPRLEFLGDASYSLYLTHLSVIVFLRKFWTMEGLPVTGLGPALLFVCFALAVSIAVGALTYASIERPMLRFLRQRFTYWTRQPEARRLQDISSP